MAIHQAFHEDGPGTCVQANRQDHSRAPPDEPPVMHGPWASAGGAWERDTCAWWGACHGCVPLQRSLQLFGHPHIVAFNRECRCNVGRTMQSWRNPGDKRAGTSFGRRLTTPAAELPIIIARLVKRQLHLGDTVSLEGDSIAGLDDFSMDELRIRVEFDCAKAAFVFDHGVSPTFVGSRRRHRTAPDRLYGRRSPVFACGTGSTALIVFRNCEKPEAEIVDRQAGVASEAKPRPHVFRETPGATPTENAIVAPRRD